MIFIDTHTHLYLENFDDDRHQTVQRAFDADVKYMLLPNIDSQSIEPLQALCKDFPKNIFPMMGLHPTDVKENYLEELKIVEEHLSSKKYLAIGEIGMDLYWDKTFIEEQKTALRKQIKMAKEFSLPVVLHVRDAFDDIFDVISELNDDKLTGVFHCFTGTQEQAEKVISLGFMLGIGGVLTFKNSGLDKAIQDISLEHMVLETDAPFLAPKPYRGKRNESAYIKIIAEKLADIKQIPLEEVASITTANAIKLFKLTNII